MNKDYEDKRDDGDIAPINPDFEEVLFLLDTCTNAAQWCAALEKSDHDFNTCLKSRYEKEFFETLAKINYLCEKYALLF